MVVYIFSNDSGENWNPINNGLPTESIMVSSITTDANGYPYIGTNQSVFKGTSTIITSLSDLQINEDYSFTLYQNYPNPFNPVTTISYSLPVKTQVELVIYNTLGESVVQLVNEEKEAGNYEVEFNSRGLINQTLSSGIYFYQLKAGSFIETKKMLMLK